MTPILLTKVFFCMRMCMQVCHTTLLYGSHAATKLLRTDALSPTHRNAHATSGSPARCMPISCLDIKLSSKKARVDAEGKDIVDLKFDVCTSWHPFSPPSVPGLLNVLCQHHMNLSFTCIPCFHSIS